MPYIFFLLFACGYLRSLKNYSEEMFSFRFVVFVSPVIIYWVLLIGGQYEVGTDYYNYLEMFSNQGNLEYWNADNEWLFVGFVKICNFLGVQGQGIFFVIAFISVFILFYVVNKLVSSKRVYLFFFVFITYSTMFNNQMNAIRQFFAVYIVMLGLVFLLERRFYLSFFIFFLASVIHQSALFIYPVILCVAYIDSWMDSNVRLAVLVIIAALFSLLGNMLWLRSLLVYLDLDFDMYIYHLENEEKYQLLNLILKYIYLPLILYSIYQMPKMNLSASKRRIFRIGVYGYSLRLALISFPIISRMGLYGGILSCLPFVFLLIFLKQHKKKVFYIAIVFFLFALYAAKVLYANGRGGEYDYNSIFFI